MTSLCFRHVLIFRYIAKSFSDTGFIGNLSPSRSGARAWREPRVDFQVSKGSPTPFLRFTEGMGGFGMTTVVPRIFNVVSETFRAVG